MSGIVDLLYVRFQVPDLDKQQAFLQKFGMVVTRQDDTIYARGSDDRAFIYRADLGDAAFLRLGFEAESEADLRRIAAIDNVPVTNSDQPGGGFIATLTDPNGYLVDIVAGAEHPPSLPLPTRNGFNSAAGLQRIGERVEFSPQPLTVKRLGHCVLNVVDFRDSEKWYKQRFGLITSDEVYIGDEEKVLGSFMRCNRGDTYVDHHTLFLVGVGEAGFNHAAFEVADWDALMAGHFDLSKSGYTHSWGIGKHLLGSQVFDYWKDPHDFTLEHFTDGDLFNESFGSHKAPHRKITCHPLGAGGISITMRGLL